MYMYLLYFCGVDWCIFIFIFIYQLIQHPPPNKTQLVAAAVLRDCPWPLLLLLTYTLSGSCNHFLTLIMHEVRSMKSCAVFFENLFGGGGRTRQSVSTCHTQKISRTPTHSPTHKTLKIRWPTNLKLQFINIHIYTRIYHQHPPTTTPPTNRWRTTWPSSPSSRTASSPSS